MTTVLGNFFGYKRHESVRELQFLCGELSLDLIWYMTFRGGNISVMIIYVVTDNLNYLHKFQVHIVCDLSSKFGTATSARQKS